MARRGVEHSACHARSLRRGAANIVAGEDDWETVVGVSF